MKDVKSHLCIKLGELGRWIFVDYDGKCRSNVVDEVRPGDVFIVLDHDRFDGPKGDWWLVMTKAHVGWIWTLPNEMEVLA